MALKTRNVVSYSVANELNNESVKKFSIYFFISSGVTYLYERNVK